MSRHDPAVMQRYRNALALYEAQEHPLPGIADPVRRDIFIKQIVDSVRRVEYVSEIALRPISPLRADPQNEQFFDPLRAALIHKSMGDSDEAGWLIFLLTHFGKHRHAGWRYLREIYGKLGEQPYWSWSEVSGDPQAFRDWLRQCSPHIMRGNDRGFGNHRKFTSMDADKPNGTGMAVQTYVDWVTGHGGHSQLFQTALNQTGGDPMQAFQWLYRSMSVVRSFARLGKFDYLAMIGKTGLAAIAPGFAYLAGSSGPRKGANLIFGNATLSTPEKERRLILLAGYLNVGMQAIEDSLCNWHKSPGTYVYFSG